MTTRAQPQPQIQPQIQPLSGAVKDAVRRNTSTARHVKPALAGMMHLVMFLLILGGCAAGVTFLWRTALADPRFRMDGETLGMGGAVRECPESVGDLRAVGLAFNGRSLLDPFLIGDLERAYGSSVWVKRIVRMRRSFPNRIDLELLLRIPAAQVKSGGRYWLIDADGVFLPTAGSAELFPRLPEIVGVTSRVMGGRPMPGEIWKDEGVTGGLGILRAFWGSPLSEVLPVERIVVNAGVFRAEDGGEREIRRRFEVVSKNGVVVRWGTFNPGSEPGDELTSAEKMWRLEELLRSDEALRPGVCFDVRTRVPGFTLMQ